MKTELTHDIARLSSTSKFPDGTSYSSISMGNVLKLSNIHKVPGLDVEIAALEAGVVPERYARNMKTFSAQQQAALLRSCVAVVGLGGLGGVVVEILARMGIGTLNLVDGDRFDENNLNRQFLSAEKTVHQAKVVAAARRIQEVNSSVVIYTHEAYLNERNADRLIGRPDVVVDCLGGLDDRFVLEKAAKRTGRPLVSGAVAGLSGRVTTIFPEDSGLELIYGNPDTLPSAGAEASLGCLPMVTTMLAAVQCSEVAKVLLHQKGVLRNHILAVDLLDNTFEVMRLTPDFASAVDSV
jgi:molybdopterin/thiamine biosynthesis adenylyltransferase